jgi:hypothetical protein
VCAEIHIGHLLGQFQLYKFVGGIQVMSNPYGVSFKFVGGIQIQSYLVIKWCWSKSSNIM